MSAPAESRRFVAFDSLRAWMMLLLVPFHAALPYISARAAEGLEDSASCAFYDGFVLFMVSFRRPVFFVVGGFFAAMMLERRGLAGFVRNRFQRIFLPLAIGWATLAPMTRAAFKFAEKTSETGSIAKGFEVLGQWRWLRWDNPYHLWFLIALIVFYAATIGFKKLLPRVVGSRMPALVAGTRRFFANPWRPLIFATFAACALIPSDFYPYNRGNPMLGLGLFLFFVLGWVLYTQVDLLESQTRNAWKYVVIGCLILPFATIAKGRIIHGTDNQLEWTIASGIAFSLMASFMVFGVLGLFLKYGSQRSATMRYLSDSSYWIYLSHMPLIVFAGGLVAPMAVSDHVKFLLANAMVIPIVLITYHTCVRYTPIGVLLNGPRERS